MTGNLEVIPLPSPRRFTLGDNLVAAILEAANSAGAVIQSGDVICIASKVVSLVESPPAALPESDDEQDARRALARDHATGIVADTPQVLITRTHHGFVAANGGIDASNVASGHALLLPVDPDRSAAEIRARLAEERGVDVGVVISDTFGRPWRMGQTDVALGVAGLPALRDERGSNDLDERLLMVTEAAVADQVAGAADLVRTKASGTPFVLVRGVPTGPHGTGADLIRPLEEDLFPAGGPTAAERAVTQRRTIREFAAGREVPLDTLRKAIATAATAPAPHHSKPWRFIRLLPDTRKRLLDEMGGQWDEDLKSDGVAPEVRQRRLERSDAVLRQAPELIAAFVAIDAAHDYPDDRRTTAERDLFLLSGGAALSNLQITLSAHGLGAAWMSSTVFCAPTIREVLGLAEHWQPLGMLAVGWPAATPPERPPRDISSILLER